MEGPGGRVEGELLVSVVLICGRVALPKVHVRPTAAVEVKAVPRLAVGVVAGVRGRAVNNEGVVGVVIGDGVPTTVLWTVVVLVRVPCVL